MTVDVRSDKGVLHIPYPELRGAGFQLGMCEDLEVAIDGPAGTGKTISALYKTHIILSMFPGAKGLIARKTSTALAGSAIASYKEHIIHPSENILFFHGNKIKPSAFEYPNGSVLVVNGLDRRDKIRSWEFDIAFLNEATELEEEDLEYVRMRLRHGKTPYHQVIMDTNPGPPTHWLYQRMMSGKTTRLISRHQDNPYFYDNVTQDWTPAGQEYVFNVLGGLTGVLYSRYTLGEWVAAENTIYEGAYDSSRNIVAPFDIPADWPRYIAVDFGYIHPFVAKWYAVDPDGRLYCYREIYHTKRLVEDHAKQMLIVSGLTHLLPKDHPQHTDVPKKGADPMPRAIICDHQAEDRATLERHLHMITTKAKKSVSDGIQAVSSRLRVYGDGKPRLMFFSTMLVERDPDLVMKKMPCSGVDEFNLYTWDTANGAKKGDMPVKQYDDSMDCDRYMVAHLDLTPIEVKYSQRVY